MDNLQRLGYNIWFQEHANKTQLELHEVARVVSVHKKSFLISNGGAAILAELTGKLSYTADSAADIPTTGDWVYVDFYENDSHAVIHDIFPRKTVIQRKTSGKSIDFQLVAANIDTAFIVQSVDYNFNLSRLERYLVMVNDSNIRPIILLSKSDLISQLELKQIIDSVDKIAPQSTIISFSNESSNNIDVIKELLLSGNTYCLLGSSGVGKTTLLNSILGSVVYETKTVSNKDNKGRHTTTSRELIQLDNGAMIIDTPGMRELSNMSVDAGIDETFTNIISLSLNCKFNNCTHVNENGCAILAAIDSGDLSEKRYKNYIKVKNESSFNEMSYFEKRQKDKNFGKMIKKTLKNKNKR
jgi:ribosome biogenesis GTPase